MYSSAPIGRSTRSISGLFENVVRRVQIPEEIADWIADALRASQGDKERFHRTAIGQLQQRYLAVQSKLDRAYDDRLAGQVTDEMWSRKSAEWETELETIRGETAKHEQASHDYAVTGSKILELAKSAHNLFIQQNSQDRARLIKTLAFELHVRSSCRSARCIPLLNPGRHPREPMSDGAWTS
jgi:hypothetical protein